MVAKANAKVERISEKNKLLLFFCESNRLIIMCEQNREKDFVSLH